MVIVDKENLKNKNLSNIFEQPLIIDLGGKKYKRSSEGKTNFYRTDRNYTTHLLCSREKDKMYFVVIYVSVR